MTDLELLHEYADDGSQTAFAALVGRHIDLVYSAARRQVRSPQMAEEVAQSVFIDLARNPWLKPGTPLVAWLYLVTRRTAIDAIRRESHRQAREGVALEIAAMKIEPSPWSQIEPLLDEAMAALSDADRTAILLRFFGDKSLREVGASLGGSENAAQKRIARALDQLRAFFLRRGIAVSAAGLATDLSAHAIQTAPAALSAAISSSAALSGAAVSHSALTATGTLAMTTTQKILIATAIAAAVTVGVYQAATLRRQEVQIAQLENLSASWQREIQRLDRQRITAAGRAAQAAATSSIAAVSDDPAFDARMRVLVENVNRLKKLLDQHPAEQIPELRFLDEHDWFSIAQRFPDPGAGTDHRAAFPALRTAAKHKFLRLAQKALQAHLKNAGDLLPTEVTQLASYFTPPVDDALLARYEMLATGPVSALAGGTLLLREKGTLAIDPSRDNRGGLTRHGTTMEAFPNSARLPSVTLDAALQKSLDRALRAFEDAHDGREPEMDEIEKLLPYFQNPEDGAKFAQQMKAASSRMMPPALNQALNEARRAYSLTHHGAEPTDQMELASYFQKPEDGARYLDFIARRPAAK